MLENVIIKITFLIFFFISAGKLFSQETINGIVINSNDKSPVEYASVSIEGRAVYQDADSIGRFKISVFESDTILISCMGFNEKRITGEVLKQNGVVELIPKVRVLPTVYTGTFKAIKVGIAETKVSFSKSANLREGIEYATTIVVPNNIKAYTVSRVSFIIRNKEKKSGACNPVRIHIYSAGSNGSPGVELLKKDVVVTEINITKNKLEVDLTEQDITLSSPSFFVAIQWLSINQQMDYKQPQISFTEKGTTPLTWVKGAFNDYQWFVPQKLNRVFGNMMVQAEIIVRQ